VTQNFIQTWRELPNWLQLGLIFPLVFLNGFLLILVINYFSSLVNYLIIANLLAFLLELVIKILEEKKYPEVVAGAFIVIPFITSQLGELLTKAPEWIENTRENLQTISTTPIIDKLPINFAITISELIDDFYNSLSNYGSEALDLLAGTISSVFNTLIVLILTIFLLISGEKFWSGILNWLPQPWNQKFPFYMEKTFKDYFFSRLILGLIAIVACSVVFIILGIPYSILFAVLFGLGSLIPIVGSVLGLFLTVVLCLYGLTTGLKFCNCSPQ
jgi:predicted PurR-regulated permease PerM